MSESGLVITVLFPIKPEYSDEVCAELADMVEDTARFPGFRDIEIVRHADTPGKVLFFEHWDNAESYQAYLDWRTERGDMDALGDKLAGPPVIQMWPRQVTRKAARPPA